LAYFEHRKSAQEAVSLKSPRSILVIAARIGLFIALGAATIYAVIRYIAWVVKAAKAVPRGADDMASNRDAFAVLLPQQTEDNSSNAERKEYQDERRIKHQRRIEAQIFRMDTALVGTTGPNQSKRHHQRCYPSV